MENFHGKEKYLALIALTIILVINVPYLILGDDFYPQFGYDNLDSNIINKKILIESGNIFSSSSTIIEEPLSGIPRVAFGAEFSFLNLLHYLFDTPIAYVMNILLIQFIGFLGMILFLREKYGHNSLFLIYSVSLIFSQLPFWPNAGISLAGIPLLLYSYLIFDKRKLLSIAILILYVVYSSFVLTGIFIIGLSWLFIIYKLLAKQSFKNILIYTILLMLLYFLHQYRLILFALDPLYVSHRSELVKKVFSFTKSFNIVTKIFFGEYGHNVKKPLLISMTTIAIFIFSRIRRITIHKDIYVYSIFIISIAFISVFIKTELGIFLTSFIKPIKMVQLQRFYWLLPPFFYMLFFLVLQEIWKTKLKWLVLVLLLIQFSLVFQKNTNFKQFLKTRILGIETDVLTFREFYSEELYHEINQYIGKPQNTYRVASIGLQPASALYNGFYTIDGYYGNYPVEYKHKFFKLIEPELIKNDKLLNRFQSQGSVVVIMSNEIIKRREGRDFVIPFETKDIPDRVINDLQLNIEILHELNCQYILSSSKILNNDELDLKYEKYFESDDSPWGIYLYSVLVH
ncbi:hypothetical protein JEZ13_08770 [bacterium]|nr:hypothetical protein [bacterium]